MSIFTDTTDENASVDWAEVDRRLWSSKDTLQRAADAAACCKGRDPRDGVDDAVRVGETAVAEVWQLYLALPEGSAGRANAYDAYDAAAAGVSALRAAAVEMSAAGADPHVDAGLVAYERALRLLGW